MSRRSSPITAQLTRTQPTSDLRAHLTWRLKGPVTEGLTHFPLTWAQLTQPSPASPVSSLPCRTPCGWTPALQPSPAVSHHCPGNNMDNEFHRFLMLQPYMEIPFMNHWEEMVNRLERRARRVRRIVPDRMNPFQAMTDGEFTERF
ncbi:hypothetical protein Pcinc_007731 [Petrolisthes cinctipes]|uniref:Uncharacterized protein n=1 Tax=Petrolisthes cinctipes TaxID=88211 RepID=A0AAE1GAC7_PETCI|nr:hypothetical protein Pcinc_007731 [Petrolisthes cinctipes]